MTAPTTTAAHLLAAETRKLRTVSTTWVLTGIGWALVVLTSLLGYLIPAIDMRFDGSARQIAGAIDAIGNNSIIVLIVGVLAITTEFRHGTIGRTLQLVPSRTRVLTAKLAASVVYSVAFVVSSLALVVAILFALSLANDAPMAWGAPVGTAIWNAFAGMALIALFGVALGALIRSQVIAVTLSLIWVFVVEQLVFGFLPRLGQWLPFSALNSIFLNEDIRAQMPPNMQYLDPGVALAVFLSYVVVFTAMAALLMRERDI